MATRLPSALPRRPTTALPFSPLTTHTSTAYLAPSHTPLSHTPSRAATLIRRPRRPYSFTQLVQLSDGSTFTIRSASPQGVYKSTKDTRNHALWNPHEKSLQNVEVDEAGKLAAFRGRFGRGWDAATEPAEETPGDASRGAQKGTSAAKPEQAGSGDALADLIAGYATNQPELPSSGPPSRGGKKK
ncbi:hypothetical protein F5X98DRAFT_38356 [Xylaria grammica]|nr:hypothetical protein F5X98DRAFT_38356 [Xylaria grammica]